MGGNASGPGWGKGGPEDEPPPIKGYSSPACMMHELDPAFMGHAETLPAAGSAQNWVEVRLWRKAKRAVLIERRLAMKAAERAARSDAITAALLPALPSHPGALIGFYWPFKGEYDPRPLVRSLHVQGIRLALPVVVQKAKPVIFREWWPGIPMANGIWNIPVPAAGDPVAPDVLLVPVVGFDRQNYRLGYGGGYYDRTLAAATTRPRTIGVGFEMARVVTIHPQPHDIPMDQVVTERTVVPSRRCGLTAPGTSHPD
jgi:5-formyltetrahydrofolate cyclo-ligase